MMPKESYRMLRGAGKVFYEYILEFHTESFVGRLWRNCTRYSV